MPVPLQPPGCTPLSPTFKQGVCNFASYLPFVNGKNVSMTSWSTANTTWSNCEVPTTVTNNANTLVNHADIEDTANEVEEEVLSLKAAELGDPWSLSAITKEFSRIETKLQNGSLLYEEIDKFNTDIINLENQKQRLEASLKFVELQLKSASIRLHAIDKDNLELSYIAEKTTHNENRRHELYSAAFPVVHSEDAQRIRTTLGDSYKKNTIERTELQEKVLYLKKQWQSIDLRLWKINECQLLIKDAIHHLRLFYPPLPLLRKSASVDTEHGKQTNAALPDGRKHSEPRFIQPTKKKAKKRKFDVLFDDGDTSADDNDMMKLDADTGYDGDSDQPLMKRTKRTDEPPTPIEKESIENHYTFYNPAAIWFHGQQPN
jgi:hypothetical protein